MKAKSNHSYTIKFYPANGIVSQRYITQEIEVFRNGFLSFLTNRGKQVVLNGSFLIEEEEGPTYSGA